MSTRKRKKERLYRVNGEGSNRYRIVPGVAGASQHGSLYVAVSEIETGRVRSVSAKNLVEVFDGN